MCAASKELLGRVLGLRPLKRERGSAADQIRVLAWSAVLALASYWFAIATLVPAADRFITANQLASGIRTLAVAGAVLVPLAAAFGTWAATRRRPELWERLALWQRACLPALVLPFLPALLSRALWKDSTLELLCLCAALTVFVEVSLRQALPLWRELWPGSARLAALSESRHFRWVLRALLALAVIFYALRVSELTLWNHQRLGTSSADLAEFDSLFFNTLHGHPFRSPPIDGTLRDWDALKVHFELLLYAFLPFYALRPGPETLLVLQAWTVALTAVPLYAFAARRVGEPLALVFALALLLLPAVEQPNFYDFHFLPLGMLCVTTVIAVGERVVRRSEPRKRWLVLFGVTFGVALLSREDIAFGLGLLGLVLAACGAVRAGTTVAVVSLLWFGIVRFVVMPRIGEMWFTEMYASLFPPGREGTGAVLETALTNPSFVLRKLWTVERLRYVLELTVPLAFLWWRKPWLLLAALPAFPFTLLVTDRPALADTSFQYVHHWIPYIFAASVLGLEGLGGRGSARRAAAAGALAFASLVVTYHSGAFLGAPFIRGGPLRVQLRSNTAGERQRLAALRRILKNLPPDASVAATEHEGPHVSTRLLSFTFYGARENRPRYLLLSERAIRSEEFMLLGKLEPEQYRLVAREGDFFLLERGEQNEAAHALLARLSGRFAPN